MADRVSKEKRSWNMSRIRSTNTSIEVLVRKDLFCRGFRYRINVKSLPGKPDIVLPKYKTVIFVHGCFWHRHSGCKYAATPSNNAGFWKKKFENNTRNDSIHTKELEELGWHVITVWQCEIKNDFKELMDRIEAEIMQHSSKSSKA